MPNVFLREGYLTSRKIASLWSNPHAERFYFHLLMVVDENTGEAEYDSLILKSKCFPAVSEVSSEDVENWILDCINAGLVKIVQSDDKKVLKLLKHEVHKKSTEKRNSGGFKTWTLEEFNSSVEEAVSDNPAYNQFVSEFTEYWTEPDANGRMRFSLQQTWRTAGRLSMWSRNNTKLHNRNRNGSEGSYGRYVPHNG